MEEEHFQSNSPDKKQETREAENLERVEKVVADVFQANVEAVDLYLAHHEFNPWSSDDFLTLCKEYQENPIYKSKFSQVLTPYIKEEPEFRIKDFREYLPASLHQRLLGHAICVLAKEQGILREEDIVSATDLISMCESPIDEINYLPNIWRKRYAIYTRLKRELGEEAIQKLRVLSLAGHALCWLIIGPGDPVGDFDSKDVLELAKQWGEDWRRANEDITAFSDGIYSLLVEGGGKQKQYFEKLKTPFMKERFRKFSQLDENAIRDLRIKWEKVRRDPIRELTDDLTHIKARVPNFEGFESGQVPETRWVLDDLAKTLQL